MKHIFLTFGFAFIFALSLFSQEATKTGLNEDTAKVAAEQLTAKYSLDQTQAAQMYVIQQRKQRNMNEIAELQTTNPEKYSQKLSNVQQITLGSMKRLLKTKEQALLFQQTQAEVRRLKSAKRKEMHAAGATTQEIDAAVNAIYAE